MSAGYMAGRVAAILAEHGAPMILARPTEATTVSVMGKRIPGGTEATGGTGSQQRFKVKITTVELAASAWTTKEPRSNGDTLTVDGIPRTVMDWIPLGDGDVVAMYELEVVG